MKTSCPHCGQHYELNDSFAGQPVTCERCWKDFMVPAEKPSAVAVPKPKPAAEAPAPKTSKPVPAAPVPETPQRCPYCSGVIPAGVKKCRHCGEWIDRSAKPQNPVAFVVLGIFCGLWGTHSFYVDNITAGVLHILATIICIPAFFFEMLNNGTCFVAGILLFINYVSILIELADCERQVALAPSRRAENTYNPGAVRDLAVDSGSADHAK